MFLLCILQEYLSDRSSIANVNEAYMAANYIRSILEASFFSSFVTIFPANATKSHHKCLLSVSKMFKMSNLMVKCVKEVKGKKMEKQAIVLQ